MMMLMIHVHNISCISKGTLNRKHLKDQDVRKGIDGKSTE